MTKSGKMPEKNDELVLMREKCAAELLHRAEGDTTVELTANEARWIAALLSTTTLAKRGAKRQDATRKREDKIAAEWEKRTHGEVNLPRGVATRIKDDLAELFHCDRRTVARAIESHQKRTAGTRNVLEMLKARQSGR